METERLPDHISWGGETGGVIRCANCKSETQLWGLGAVANYHYQVFLDVHTDCPKRKNTKPAAQLTAREAMAAQLMGGMMASNIDTSNVSPEHYAKSAVKAADALLRYLARPDAEDEDLVQPE